MGGESIFRVAAADPNRNVIVETLLRGRHKIGDAQRYIPEIRDGDKRTCFIAGKPVPHCLARIPKPGETRAISRRGNRCRENPFQARPRDPQALGPRLAERGLLLVGLDVIGDC